MAAYTHVQAHSNFITQGKLDKYNPELYGPELAEKLRNNLLVKKITNGKFKGSFHNKGDKILIREKPVISAKVFNDNSSLTYENPETFYREYTINRAAYWAFRVRRLQELFSDVAPFAPVWIDEAVKGLAEEMEKEFLSSVWKGTQNLTRFDGSTSVPNSTIFHNKDGSGNEATTYGGAHASNQGNTAGLTSGSFALGTDASPVFIYKTESAMASGSETYKNLMPDLIADCGTVLAEQPGSDGIKPWIIVPPIAANRIQTSELKNASLAGDSVSILRRGIEAIGEIAGFTVYQSNLLPVAANDDDDKVFTCLFGDNSATSFVEEVSEQKVTEDPNSFDKLHASMVAYDFFVHYPERLGVAKIAFPA